MELLRVGAFAVVTGRISTNTMRCLMSVKQWDGAVPKSRKGWISWKQPSGCADICDAQRGGCLFIG
ncbi:MAG: hypothetical protein K2P35_02990 [Lachnospiraceae bacterium]|nr:hypothetical protein [Lachnospiraceae bacterium]